MEPTIVCGACGHETVAGDYDEETGDWYATRHCPECDAELEAYDEPYYPSWP